MFALTCWQEIFTFKERHNTSSEDLCHVDLVWMRNKVFTAGRESYKEAESSSPRVCGFRNVMVQLQHKMETGEEKLIYIHSSNL